MNRPYSVMRFITIVLVAIPFFAIAQPKERQKNRYREANMAHGAPYTLFDVNGATNKLAEFNTKVEELKMAIHNAPEGIFYAIYKTAYEVVFLPATTTTRANPSAYSKWTQGYDPLSTYAKNKAFIAIVGINPYNYDTITKRYETLSPVIIAQLKDEAYSALENMNTDVLNLIRLNSWDLNAGKMLLFRNWELVNYLEAYDMLKACGRIPDKDFDKNGVMQNPRNRLREFTRNIYKTGMGSLGWGVVRWGDNHSLRFCGTIGLAAIVLNEAGAANLRIHYRPDRWADRAHKYLNKKMWEGSFNRPRLAVEGQLSGYAEGTSYYEYAMELVMPFLRGMHNFVPEGVPRDYLSTTKWDELFQWRHQLTLSNGRYLPYDNSVYGAENTTLLAGKKEYNYLPTGVAPPGGLDLLALHPAFYSEDSRARTVNMPDAGLSVLRMNSDEGNKHYFLMQHETGDNLCGTGHEDVDMGSFQLGADDDLLVFDPTYLGAEEKWRTNDFSHHNTVLLLKPGEDKVAEGNRLWQRQYVQVKESESFNGGTYHQIKLSMLTESGSAQVTRNLKMIKDFNDHIYYILLDDINKLADYEYSKVAIQINGNGSSSDVASTFHQNGAFSYWTHPCDKLGSRWNLAVTSSAINGNNNPLSFADNAVNTHHCMWGNLTDYRDKVGDRENGYNSRLRIIQESTSAFIQTVMIPYRCGQDAPLMVRRENDNSVGTAIFFEEGTTFHLNKLPNQDTIHVDNPLDSVNTGKTMITDADDVMLSFASDSIFKTKNYCESYTYFRKASIDSGAYLFYDNKYYINSSQTKNFNAYYELAAKYKYTGYVSIGSAHSIAFYLPEVDSGFNMMARGEFVTASSYNMSTRIMTVTFAKGTGEFTMELADPCKLSCFFPPTVMSIDTTFEFTTGTTEVLAHDLQITSDEGYMLMNNASVMSICPRNIFINSDSLIMVGPYNKQVAPVLDNCDKNSVIYNRPDRTIIEVSSQAALLLDSGSYTRVGGNSSIIVHKGGSLIIKPYATLVIGSADHPGYGEVILEDSASLCVEAGAKIRFFKQVGDTSDKNLFWVFNNAQPNTPNSIIGYFVNTSDEAPIACNKLVDSGYLHIDTTICIGICGFPATFPTYGIGNREWGYFPGALPLSTFKLAGDTLCPHDSVVIDARRVLNERDWMYSVCRVNPEDSVEIPGTCLTEGEIDYPIGDGCLPGERVPEWINLSKTYMFEQAGLYKIYMVTVNSCDEMHDTVKYVYIAPDPVAYINFPDEICESAGVTPDSCFGFTGTNNRKHTWIVEPLSKSFPDTLSENEPEDYSFTWDRDTVITNTFDFPGYTFKGGDGYIVTLQVQGWCSVAEYVDTLYVPLFADVSISAKPGVYNNPLGPSALQLNGAVAEATSWSWSPTIYLSDSTVLNPVATPTGPITYVLTVNSGSCTISDSIEILYKNHIAYAGENRLLCTPDSITMGTGYMLAAFFGAAHNTFHGYPSYINLLSATSDDVVGLSRLLIEDYTTNAVFCSALEELLIDERFLDKVIAHPAFASYYEAFMQNPLNTTNIGLFCDRLTAMNELVTTPESYCVDDYMEGLFNRWQECGTYRLYPDFSNEAALLLGALYVKNPNPGEFADSWNAVKTGTLHAVPAFMKGFLESGALGETSCDFSALLDQPDLNDVYYSRTDFQAYYDSLLYGHGDLDDIMLLFSAIYNLGGSTQTYIDGLSLDGGCYQEFWDAYEAWLASDCISHKHIVWEKKDATSSWTYLPDWDGKYNMYDDPAENTQYRITVLDLFNNTVEYDIADITVDTALAPLFAPNYQTDSTVYFTNYTFSLNQPGISYLWVFGDGDSSTATNPVHTFPAFDAEYIICLYAANTCGTYQYCDTIMVDSTMLYFFEAGKKGNDNEPFKWNEPKVKHDLSQLNGKTSVLSNRNILGNNRPNPFDGVTEIDYELVPGYKTAELIVTNILGQTVSRINIPTVKGTIRYSKATLQDGMYFYSLMVDGIKAGNKIMVVK